VDVAVSESKRCVSDDNELLGQLSFLLFIYAYDYCNICSLVSDFYIDFIEQFTTKLEDDMIFNRIGRNYNEILFDTH